MGLLLFMEYSGIRWIKSHDIGYGAKKGNFVFPNYVSSSWDWNALRITGHLWGESTGHFTDGW